MKATSPFLALLTVLGAAAWLAAPGLNGGALADPAGDTSDPVTGYHCIDRGCQTVTLPNADCICVKQNPGEQTASKVVFQCSTKRDGAWVACPVKPRYGISLR